MSEIKKEVDPYNFIWDYSKDDYDYLKEQQILEKVVNLMQAYHSQFPSAQEVTDITDEDLDYITEKIDEFLRNFPEYRCLDVIGKYKTWMRSKLTGK